MLTAYWHPAVCAEDWTSVRPNRYEPHTERNTLSGGDDGGKSRV